MLMCYIFGDLGFTSTPLLFPRIRTEEAWVLLVRTSPNSKHLLNPSRRKKMRREVMKRNKTDHLSKYESQRNQLQGTIIYNSSLGQTENEINKAEVALNYIITAKWRSRRHQRWWRHMMKTTRFLHDCVEHSAPAYWHEKESSKRDFFSPDESQGGSLNPHLAQARRLSGYTGQEALGVHRPAPPVF
nr:uncharacterized protein LOC110136368 isoform X2 [Odocoileus virginianus texanus]